MSENETVSPDVAWLAAVKPATHVNPEPRASYHLVVVGGGPAGLICAMGAAGLGAKVALVERHRMGGDCLNVGCVPTKALLEFVRKDPLPTFGRAFSWLRQVRADIAPHDSVARYTEAGVDVFLGDGVFQDRRTLKVGDLLLRGRRFAICTGAAPSMPPIPGLAELDPLTNESLFDIDMQPPRLAVLGAGPIGCELAEAFARLGSEVHLFEQAAQVLPMESEGAAGRVAEALRANGVQLHLGRSVDRAWRERDMVIQAGDTQVHVDDVLVALGRTPNTRGLALDRAGVRTDERGIIQVDRRLRTSNRRIYAAGDCASTLQFTHHADAQAKVLIQNALFLPTARADRLVVPRCTYTQPEVATVGDGEAVLRKAGVPFDRYAVDFTALDRGRADPTTSGYAEVFTAKGSDRLLGACIVAPDAGEQIAPLCLMMSNGLGLGAANVAILPYPTRGEYLKRLAAEFNRTRMTPRVGKLMRRWFRFTDG
ncbi:MAG: FAD-dependent oxidoreductase [Pseudomonadales bacterium]